MTTPTTPQDIKIQALHPVDPICKKHNYRLDPQDEECPNCRDARYKATPQESDCYCVCHSEFSSRPSCQHCERAVKVAISSERTRLLGEVRELVEGKRIYNENGYFYKKITHADEELKEIQVPSMKVGYNQALDDLLPYLSQLEGEQK